MKIIVISLPSSQSRRVKVIEKLGSKNIDFEFLDAVDGRTGNHPYLKNYNEKAFLANRRRVADPGELGCYVSHLLAWEKCIHLDEPIVVLEDDFELTESFDEGIQFVGQFLDRVSFIRLEPLESNFFVTSVRNHAFSLVKQLKIAMCATGYVITPKGAKALLKKGMEISFPIDLYLKYTIIHQQPIHALVPNIVYPTHVESTIGSNIRNHRKKGITLKINRFIRKWAYVLANTSTNLSNIFKTF